jgi:hypothetical protein
VAGLQAIIGGNCLVAFPCACAWPVEGSSTQGIDQMFVVSLKFVCNSLYGVENVDTSIRFGGHIPPPSAPLSFLFHCLPFRRGQGAGFCAKTQSPTPSPTPNSNTRSSSTEVDVQVLLLGVRLRFLCSWSLTTPKRNPCHLSIVIRVCFISISIDDRSSYCWILI